MRIMKMLKNYEDANYSEQQRITNTIGANGMVRTSVAARKMFGIEGNDESQHTCDQPRHHLPRQSKPSFKPRQPSSGPASNSATRATINVIVVICMIVMMIIIIVITIIFVAMIIIIISSSLSSSLSTVRCLAELRLPLHLMALG